MLCKTNEKRNASCCSHRIAASTKQMIGVSASSLNCVESYWFHMFRSVVWDTQGLMFLQINCGQCEAVRLKLGTDYILKIRERAIARSL